MATLAKGEIVFEPFLPPGIRVKKPFTPPVRIRVTSIEEDSRQPRGLETWSVSRSTNVFRVHTEGAVLEWAVPVLQRDWVVAQVC